MLQLFVVFAALVFFARVMVWVRKHCQVDFPFKIAFLLLFLVCGVLPVFAAEMIPAHEALPAASPWGAALATFLQDTVFPVIAAMVLGVVTLLLNRLGQRWKIQALTEKNNFLFQLAEQGVALAQERAAKLAGSVSELTGNQKLDIAVGHMLSFAPKISPLQAQDIVHSVLAQIPGLGATGDEVVAIRPPAAASNITNVTYPAAGAPGAAVLEQIRPAAYPAL